MSRVTILAVTVFVFGLAACKQKEPPRQIEESASPTVPATETTATGLGADAGTGAADAASGDGTMAHNAGNCPSTVLGATTTAQVKAKAVVVTVSSKDKDAIAAIQKRAEGMLKARLDGKAGAAHDQQGTHGGKNGLCPIVIPEGAKATAKNNKAGVVVTITPTDNVDDLKQ